MVPIVIELEAEMLRALDWKEDAPPGTQVARSSIGALLRSSIGALLKGMLLADLGAILVKYRAACARQGLTP